jgi:hypothetical protein
MVVSECNCNWTEAAAALRGAAERRTQENSTKAHPRIWSECAQTSSESQQCRAEATEYGELIKEFDHRRQEPQVFNNWRIVSPRSRTRT